MILEGTNLTNRTEETCKACGERAVEHGTGECHRCYQRRWRKTNPQHNRRDGSRAAQKKAWEEANDRPLCPWCGKRRGVGQQRANPEGLCIDCRREAWQSRRLARRHQIERLWNLGRSLREIAQEMETTPNAIGTELSAMRNEGGWDVPHRYAVKDGRRVAA